MVGIFEVLAEPNRRNILQLVWNHPRSAGQIAEHFEITFGAVSQHLHKLTNAGVLDVQKQGRSRIYRARKESLGPMAKALEAMWSDALDRLKSIAESELSAETHRKDTGSRAGKGHE